MPRESIHRDDPEQQTFKAVVGWQRDQHVQLGIQVTDADRHLVDVLYGGEGGYLTEVGTSLFQQLEAAGWSFPAPPEPVDQVGLGQMVLNALRHSRPAIERDGIWTDLTRHQINELIRTLRKARDQAYGADA